MDTLDKFASGLPSPCNPWGEVIQRGDELFSGSGKALARVATWGLHCPSFGSSAAETSEMWTVTCYRHSGCKLMKRIKTSKYEQWKEAVAEWLLAGERPEVSDAEDHRKVPLKFSARFACDIVSSRC